jgi:trk system potassium uptake protein TrkA
MNVVILGCGRTGATLSLQLASNGHKVTVIECSPDALHRIENHKDMMTVIIGNGLDHDVLLKADIDNADAFFALTRGDNTNLMAAQIVKREYGVERVAVKVADPQRAEAYNKLGLFCINASALLAGMCGDWLRGSEYKPVDEYNVLIPELKF